MEITLFQQLANPRWKEPRSFKNSSDEQSDSFKWFDSFKSAPTKEPIQLVQFFEPQSVERNDVLSVFGETSCYKRCLLYLFIHI